MPFTRVSHYGTLKSFTMRKMLLDRKNHLSHMFSAQSTPFHQVSSISDMLAINYTVPFRTLTHTYCYTSVASLASEVRE